MGRRPRGCSERVERMASAWSAVGSMGVGGWKVAYMWSEEGRWWKREMSGCEEEMGDK